MRFVLYILLPFAIALPVFAAPGDTFSAVTKWSTQPGVKRQIRSNDTPVTPSGFTATKSVSNLGNVAALAVIKNDIFIADTDQNRVLRLKSRNSNASFETRAEFLIGFDNISDLAATNDVLYMSDNAGVWQISVGEMLIATGLPKLIYENPSPSESSIHIAMSPGNRMLIIGQGNSVVALELATNRQRTISTGAWQLQDIAVSPGGGIWASVEENGNSYIMPMRSQSTNAGHLKLPFGATANHIQFWNKDAFPKDWPDNWASDLILSIKGNRPMIARAHFNYGAIDAEFTSFIDGFSLPSRFVGRREYWGIPSAIDMLSNGQLIFVEQEQGTLWVLEKDIVKETDPSVDTNPMETPEPNPELEKKSIFPDLLKGSSIQSASGLETDKLLKKPEQEKPNNEHDKRRE